MVAQHGLVAHHQVTGQIHGQKSLHKNIFWAWE